MQTTPNFTPSLPAVDPAKPSPMATLPTGAPTKPIASTTTKSESPGGMTGGNRPNSNPKGFLTSESKPKSRIEVIKPKEGTNLSSLKEVAMVVLGAVAKEEGAEPTGQESVLVTDTGHIIITGASPKAVETLREVLEKIEK